MQEECDQLWPWLPPQPGGKPLCWLVLKKKTNLKGIFWSAPSRPLSSLEGERRYSKRSHFCLSIPLPSPSRGLYLLLPGRLQ